MRELWLELIVTKQGVQSTYVFTNNLNSSAPVLEYRTSDHTWMGLSIEVVKDQYSIAWRIMMLHVLYAMLQHALQRSLFQEGYHVLPHGLGSTMDTSWLADTIQFTKVESLSVLM